MTLSSLNLTDYYFFLEDILVVINNHAVAEEYVVIKRRIKISKKSVIRKINLICDRERVATHKEHERRDTDNRRCECSFDVVAINEKDKE